ncbi:hypothetical protein KM043_006634 [Ampulex compressa]|nr:hypothetical protein KM043_006634 [Ampulex compressa]
MQNQLPSDTLRLTKEVDPRKRRKIQRPPLTFPNSKEYHRHPALIHEIRGGVVVRDTPGSDFADCARNGVEKPVRLGVTALPHPRCQANRSLPLARRPHNPLPPPRASFCPPAPDLRRQEKRGRSALSSRRKLYARDAAAFAAALWLSASF